MENEDIFALSCHLPRRLPLKNGFSLFMLLMGISIDIKEFQCFYLTVGRVGMNLRRERAWEASAAT